jgi:hypothetical protein
VVIAPWPKALRVGAQVTARAEVVDDAGGKVESRLTWSSSRPEVARIDSDGVIELRSAGETEITVRSGGLTDSRALTVAAAPRPVPWLRLIVGLAAVGLIGAGVWLFWPGPAASGVPVPPGPGVTPSSASVVIPEANLAVRVGESGAIRLAEARDSLGADGRDRVVWTSQSPAVATVDPYGTVRGRQAGTTRVVATLDGAADTVMVAVSGSNAVAPSRPTSPAPSPPPPPAAVVVREPTPSPAPAPSPPPAVVPVAPPPAPPPAFVVADSVRKLGSLTDPGTITAIRAREAIEMYLLRLKGRLSTPRQRVEAALFVARAYENIEQKGDACRVLREAEPEARTLDFQALLVYLPLVCQ